MFPETKQHTWTTFRDSVSSADTGITAAAGAGDRKWANRPTAKIWDVIQKASTIVLRFRHLTGTSCIYNVYAYRDNDDAEFVCTGTATKGTQEATMTNSGSATLYAHKITVTDRWNKEVSPTDVSGNNEMAKILFDGTGVSKVLVELTTITGGGSVSVDVTSFN